MGAKIPQQSSPSTGRISAAIPIFDRSLKNGAPNQEVWTPIFIDAHIQLAGNDLTNDHIFKSPFRSALADTSLFMENIAYTYAYVNLNWPPVKPGASFTDLAGSYGCSSQTGEIFDSVPALLHLRQKLCVSDHFESSTRLYRAFHVPMGAGSPVCAGYRYMLRPHSPGCSGSVPPARSLLLLYSSRPSPYEMFFSGSATAIQAPYSVAFA